MALYQLHFLPPSASFNLSLYSEPKKSYLKRNSHQNLVHGGVVYASLAEKARKTKGKPSRAAMSDEDLCKELREVMLVAGLPSDRVPLMKELCEHGREDLANIVRRRGYKVLRVLLIASNLSDNLRENSFVEDEERSDPQGDEASVFGTNGVNGVVHALEEEQQPGSDRVINQAKSIETNEDLASNMVVFAEDNSKTEIDHLKALLHQKEMELAELKQHIEKEKHALSLLQARAKNEIDNVHRVILTKDTELRASKDKLSELNEVQVQFCVNGESVVVAGSFNGWHKQIKMNMHPSRTVDVQGSRVSNLWSTILWLYPGTYEIKFIVDGEWMIDPQREVTTHGHITNNVFRVGR